LVPSRSTAIAAPCNHGCSSRIRSILTIVERWIRGKCLGSSRSETLVEEWAIEVDDAFDDHLRSLNGPPKKPPRDVAGDFDPGDGR
jgi:hypothetical protein